MYYFGYEVTWCETHGFTDNACECDDVEWAFQVASEDGRLLAVHRVKYDGEDMAETLLRCIGKFMENPTLQERSHE